MKMKCPHCGISGVADESLGGRKVKCPKCTNFFLIPRAADSSPEQAADVDPVISSELGSTGLTVEDTSQIDDMSKAEGAVSDKQDETDLKIEGVDELDESTTDSVMGSLSSAEEVSIEDLDDTEETAPEINPEIGATGGAIEATEQEGESDTSAETVQVEEIGEGLTPVDVQSESDVSEEPEFPDFSEETFDWEEDDTSQEKNEEESVVSSEIAEQELQAELEAMLAGTCSICGKTIDDDDGFNEDNKLLCSDCFQSDATGLEPDPDENVTKTDAFSEDKDGTRKKPKLVLPEYSLGEKFSVGGILKESWVLTKGVKGSIWLGTLTMLLILFSLGSLAVFLLPLAGAPAGGTVAAWVNILTAMLGTALSMAFVAGLINIGVRRVAGASFSWNLVFSGFARFGSIVIAGFLMTLLITSGFFLFVLPGIYLVVGYSLVFPLILDKGMGPWDAMEASRKAIHKRWWQIFVLYILMHLVYFISTLPLFVGMIWTIPMFFTLTGVLYRRLFSEAES